MSTVEVVLPADVPTSMSAKEGRKLSEIAEGRTVLELGAWQGYSTIILAQVAHETHSVDWHHGDPHAGEGSTLGSYLRNLQRYGLLTDVVTHIGRFEHVLPAMRNHYFDVVFIDGQHDYESVRSDTEQALRLVKTGGTLAFHDYGVQASSEGGGAFGVTRVVDELPWPLVDLVDSLAIVHT